MTQCAVHLPNSKVNIKKVIARLRQYARGHTDVQVLLNPHNVACMHKVSHLLRMMQTNGAYAGVLPFAAFTCAILVSWPL